MSHVSNHISLFHSQIKNKRFDEETLEILESLFVTKDVKSLLDVRASLREFLRFESLSVIREIQEKSAEEKLLVIEFFVRAFALAGDVESCLALRYEALVMRDLTSSRNQRLQVSFKEWLTFAEHSLNNRFYSIAKKACEKALLCFQMNDKINPQADSFSENMHYIEKIKRLKDIAVTSATSRSAIHSQLVNYSLRILFCEKSVQAQTAEYLKNKAVEHITNSPLVFKERQHPASILFRNGIKKHNIRKLQEHRRLLDYPKTTLPHNARSFFLK